MNYLIELNNSERVFEICTLSCADDTLNFDPPLVIFLCDEHKNPSFYGFNICNRSSSQTSAIISGKHFFDCDSLAYVLNCHITQIVQSWIHICFNSNGWLPPLLSNWYVKDFAQLGITL